LKFRRGVLRAAIPWNWNIRDPARIAGL